MIGLVDFKKHYHLLKPDIDKSVIRVLSSGKYVLDKNVIDFEKKLSRYVGTKYAVGLASGTNALTIAVKSLGLSEEDGVLIPANVYPTAFGVALSGVQIQLCDVNKDTLNVDLDNIKKSIKDNTKAVVVVHLYGNPVDIKPIRDFLKKRNLFLIEDCAQSIGATYHQKKVGSFADVSVFSFYPTKNLGAFGDGGALLTSSKKIYEKAILYRMYGEKRRYESVLVGENSRLDEIQAAILLTKLKCLEGWNNKRRDIANIYKKSFSDLPIVLTKVQNLTEPVYHLFTLRINNRNLFMEFLKNKGISSAIHYPVPIHLTKAFSNLGYKKGDFPVCEDSSKKIVSIPLYPEMDKKQINTVVETIRKYFNK